jgi:hypothetical protein
MQYSKTYVGVILMLLGWLGLSGFVTDVEVSSIVDNVLQVVGIAVTTYGRYKAGGVNLFGKKV